MEGKEVVQRLNVTCRYAEHRDYDQIINNLKSVYCGNDYLIVNYHDFIRDPNVHNFVAEVDGKVVAYKALVLDGPNETVGIGGRVHPDYAGKNIFAAFSRKSDGMMKEKFPSLKTYTWTTMSSPLYADKKKVVKMGISVHELWHYPFWFTTKEKVSNLVTALDRMPVTIPVISPSPEEATEKLLAPHNAKYLFPTAYIIGYYNWLPQRVTLKNIKRFVGAHRVLFSMASKQQIAAVSFLSSHKVPRGNMSGINFYENGADIFTFLGHLKNQLEHIIRTTEDKDEIILNINCLPGICMEKVKDIVYPYIGRHVENEIIHHDSFVFASVPFEKISKL